MGTDDNTRKGKPGKVTSEVTEPGNTIIDLGAPEIVVTKADAPKKMVPTEMLETTRLEIEAGQKALEAYK